ncbi:MAG TPA: NUDIX domain-containing protein [Candidatus Moranbacteria bacterium]|nr:NUDIX domain-containing protein [Candidatus Moranbacteria bacterium]
MSFKNRIRAATIIIKDEKILLVKHVHPIDKHEWWVPPGGGIEDSDKSSIECAKRETFEETGYEVKIDNSLKFVREFFCIENDTLNLELFFNAEITGGELTINNIQGNGPDEHYIKDVKWINSSEIKKLDVFPEELKQNFGRNIKNIYLGRQS